MPAEQHATFCRERSGDDSEFCAELEDLLAISREESRVVLDTPLLANAIADPLDDEPTDSLSTAMPTEVGPFRCLEAIGEGGMGTVYRAEQSKPVRRVVAVKVIAPGMNSRRIIARFDAERQALARMHHPNIAEIFEAGTAEDGRPWFAMEFVQGEPLTKWCDRNRLAVRERVALFQRVCNAVQHAHHKGVIHRDLKPGNVLVTEVDGQAQPKIIDFGIARAIDEQQADAGGLTLVHEVVGTPSYMSPEQLQRSADVDSRTDVFSLGVMLYELLAGELPFATADDRSERLDHTAEPPSTRVERSATSEQFAAARAVDASMLRRQLRGDLDWITLRALEPEPERRYATAAEFGADLQRYLDDEPVAAGPPSLAYRLKKTMRRHRVAISASALVFGSLVAGVIVSANYANDAREQSRVASAERQSAVRLLHALHDKLRRSEAEAPFYGSPELNRRQLVDLRRGILEEASPGYAAKHKRAVAGWAVSVEGYKQGLADLAALVGTIEHQGDPVVRSAMASLLQNLGHRATEYGWPTDAERYLSSALSLAEDRSAFDPVLVEVRYSWLKCLLELGPDRLHEVKAAASRWIEEGKLAFLPKHSVFLAVYRSQRGAAHLRLAQPTAAELDVTTAIETIAEVADGSDYHRDALAYAVELFDARGRAEIAQEHRSALAQRIATHWRGTEAQCRAVLLPDHADLWQALGELRGQVEDKGRDLDTDAAAFVATVEARGITDTPAASVLGFQLTEVANRAANAANWRGAGTRALFELAVRLLRPNPLDAPSASYDRALCLLGMATVPAEDFERTEELAKELLERRRPPNKTSDIHHWIAHRHLAECENHDGQFEMADRRFLRAIKGFIEIMGVDDHNVRGSLGMLYRIWERRETLDAGVERLRAEGLLDYEVNRQRMANWLRSSGRADLAKRVMRDGTPR
mgnify:CR=1 FL=1